MILPLVWLARCTLVFLAGLTVGARAQSSLISIETVAVGDPGNLAFSNYLGEAHGAVSYEFEIGKYEVTIEQYTKFLNAVASVTSEDHIRDLWNTNMAEDATIAGIARSGGGVTFDPYRYREIGSGRRPITYVSWFDAARFANWMNNGATNGASTETGAYTLNGATTGIITKNDGATWWIPSENEWYKAAYYKGGGTNAGYWLYPTQNNAPPGNTIGGAADQANYKAGGVYAVTQSSSLSGSQNYLTDAGAFSNSASAYDTFDQGGNVWEWNDTVISGSSRGLRGGSWFDIDGLLQSSFRHSSGSLFESDLVGFRVASVPEPSTYALVLMAGAGWLLWRRRKITP